jgi:SAF domain
VPLKDSGAGNRALSTARRRGIPLSTPTIQNRGSRRDTAQPSSRLPAPVRERRPALAALAVLLILGGALASGLLVLRSGERADYLVVRGDVQPGTRIAANDLGVARIAGTGAAAISASQRGQVVGQYARTRLFPGTLLTSDMISARSLVPADSAVVGVVLSAERRPAGDLSRGDVVAVYTVPRPDESGGEATELLSAVEVVDVNAISAGGGAQLAISLLVPKDRAQDVTLRATLNQLAVAELAPGTTPLVSSTDER